MGQAVDDVPNVQDDTIREANSSEVSGLRNENEQLMAMTVEPVRGAIYTTPKRRSWILREPSLLAVIRTVLLR